MPEHPGFELKPVDGRSMVRLRVRPKGADTAGKLLDLPRQASQCRLDDPAACWLGPDQWLLTSDTKPAKDLISRIDRTLSDQLYAATDISSSNVCFSLSGPAARSLLAMGCGIDMHRGSFTTGQCVHTHFANVLLFIVVVGDNNFDLYVDRSLARYLGDWFVKSGGDPITRESNDRKMTVR